MKKPAKEKRSIFGTEWTLFIRWTIFIMYKDPEKSGLTLGDIWAILCKKLL